MSQLPRPPLPHDDYEHSHKHNGTALLAAAFAAIPPSLQAPLLHSKRLILVANNPSIHTKDLEQLLAPTDFLVLFNDFIHADFFARHPTAHALPKLLFFRKIGDSLLHFGLPPRSHNVAAISDMLKYGPLGVLFGNTSYQFPSPAADPRPSDDPITPERILEIPPLIAELLSSDTHSRVLSEQHPVVADYPIFEDIHSSAPTSGFLLYRLLLAARQQQGAEHLPSIVMLGFNHEDNTAHFWEGHNWAFERQELAAPPRGVRVIRHY